VDDRKYAGHKEQCGEGRKQQSADHGAPERRILFAAFAEPGDIAVGLSTSGNSHNVLRGLDEAARRGLLTVGFAGYTGGRMADVDVINYLFVVPSLSVHRIQEAQTTLYHVLWELTQQALTE